MSKVLTMGEVLLRLSTNENSVFSQADSFAANYGGGEANVAIALSNFGHDVRFVTKLPDNKIADKAINELYKMKVDTSCIERGGERIGIYFLEQGSSVRPSKVIYDRKYSAISQASVSDFDLDKIFEDVSWFHFSGITPALSKEAAELTKAFVKEAKRRDVKISVDINYRSKLWGIEEAKLVMSELVKDVDVAFVGPMDCINLFDCNKNGMYNEVTNEDKFATEPILKDFANLYNIRYIVNSQRYCISATHNIVAARILDKKSGKFYYSAEYDVDSIVDRVGTGDALAAGVISPLMENIEDYERAIEFGTASSAFKHTINGDYSIASREDVEQIMKSGGKGSINR